VLDTYFSMLPTSHPRPTQPPPGVGKWVPVLFGKAKVGMVHSVSGWMPGVQVKLWDALRMCAIRGHLRGVITTRRYTNPRLRDPLLTAKRVQIYCVTCCCKWFTFGQIQMKKLWLKLLYIVYKHLCMYKLSWHWRTVLVYYYSF